jgi:hypothetical protein
MPNGDPSSVEERPISFSRWQARTIEQLGYAINLILTLSVAALGYELALLLDEKVPRLDKHNCLLVLSISSFTLSIGAGIWCVINRLRDFRATAQTARRREQGASELELQPLRSLTDSLGKRTWLLFWWQIGAFGIGILLLVLAVGWTLARTLIERG